MERGTELEFEVIQAQEGTYAAACYARQIFTEGSNLRELHDNIQAAIDRHFPNNETKPIPSSVKIILFRDTSV